MAVRGLDLFQKRFAGYKDSFVLIGGAACDMWFSDQDLTFRVTKDLDIVLILEALTPEFITQFLNFIRDGDYEVRNRNTDGPPVLYRFTHPANVAYPEILELFSRADDRLILKEDQQIIPIQMNETQYLSAILLNETYYDFLLQHCHSSKGIQIAEGEALIPFKARAWLDLKNRKDSGEQVEEKDIKKHRNDVFKLALTLSGKLRAPLPFEIAADLRSFLQKLPIGHEDWPAILISIKSTIGGTFKPSKLISEIQTYYQLSA